jgi:type I restriction enzyme R subunit
VLKSYTPVDSYYKLVKKTEDDPEFDTRKANKKLRRYVESHEHAIRLKTEIMVDHFHEQVLAAGKIGGQARAMVVTNGIERAIQYFFAFKTYLVERKSPTTRSSPSRASTTTAARGSARFLSTAFQAATSPPRSRPTRTAS